MTYAAYQYALMVLCLVGLAALIITPAFALAWRKVRSFASVGKIQFALVAAFVCCFVQYGATKGGGGGYTPRISWDEGLTNAGSSISEDGYVDIRWNYSGIPSASVVFIDYKPLTGGEWVNLGVAAASEHRFAKRLANARDYQYFVYSTYTPPPPVHTNGVWVGKAYRTTGNGKGFVVVQSRITEDGKVIATPEQVKKENEQ